MAFKSFNKGVKNLKSITKKPVGSLFVQLKPRLNEGEYQTGFTCIEGGSYQFLRLREFTGGNHLITKFT